MKATCWRPTPLDPAWPPMTPQGLFSSGWAQWLRSRTTLRSCHKGSQVHTPTRSTWRDLQSGSRDHNSETELCRQDSLVRGCGESNPKNVCSALLQKPTYPSSLGWGSVCTRRHLSGSMSWGCLRPAGNSLACFLRLPTPYMLPSAVHPSPGKQRAWPPTEGREPETGWGHTCSSEGPT